MRVLITGATGLIGKELGKSLVEAGHTIHAISRHAERARWELPFPADLFTWAGPGHEFPQAALEGVDAVIALAGESVAEGRWSEEKKRRIRDSRVLGTRALVEAIAARAVRPQAFILGSAIGIYGDRADERLTEESDPGRDFLAQVVEDWEGEADPLEGLGVRVCKVRTGIVLSNRGGALMKMLPVFAKGLGGKLASGQQWMSWIHIVDIVRAFQFCLEHDSAKGVYNGTAPHPARNDRLTIALARAVGRPVFLPVPESALKVALGEMASAVLGSQRVMPERLLNEGFEFRYPELAPALDELCAMAKDGQHEFIAEQWVPRKPEEIFPYFCSETNLEELTPPFLRFRVLGKSTPSIERGTLIDYRLSLHGIPMKWRTEIEDWTPTRGFVDNQLSGPYRKWHHTHEFVPFAGGTLMKDRVLYKLPLGLLGDTVAGWKVAQDVSTIFAYRRKKIGELFGGAGEARA